MRCWVSPSLPIVQEHTALPPCTALTEAGELSPPFLKISTHLNPPREQKHNTPLLCSWAHPGPSRPLLLPVTSLTVHSP